MLRSVYRFARTLTLCSACLVVPTLAGAEEGSGGFGSRGGFGSGAVFVGRGGEVNRGVTFGFGEGRGVAIVGGSRSNSFERYYSGRRPENVGSRSSYRPDRRERIYDQGAVVIDRSYGRRGARDLRWERLEARRQQFENHRRVQADGSFIRLRDAGRIDRFERDPRYENRRDRQNRGYQGSRTLTSFDVGDWNSGVGLNHAAGYLGAVEQGSPLISGPVGPKIMNVETERLDRRPIGPSGLDTVITEGGSKIIRIAPGYRMAAADRRQPATERNGRAATPNDGSLGLQPWSTDWLRYCQRTQRSFDPDLGTYVTEGGQVRFCTAE